MHFLYSTEDKLTPPTQQLESSNMLWTTKSGMKIQIGWMRDNHLINSINMTIRAHNRVRQMQEEWEDKLAACTATDFNGEEAQDAVYGEYCRLLSDPPVSLTARDYRLLEALKREARSRNLQWDMEL